MKIKDEFWKKKKKSIKQPFLLWKYNQKKMDFLEGKVIWCLFFLNSLLTLVFNYLWYEAYVFNSYVLYCKQIGPHWSSFDFLCDEFLHILCAKKQTPGVSFPFFPILAYINFFLVLEFKQSMERMKEILSILRIVYNHRKFLIVPALLVPTFCLCTESDLWSA